MRNYLREYYDAENDDLIDISEYHQEHLIAVIDDIGSLDSYHPGDQETKPHIEEFLRSYYRYSLESFFENIEDGDLSAYEDRIKRGIQAFEDNDPYTAIFIFISIQDGLMSWICSKKGAEKNEKGFYESDTKQDVLAKEYRQRLEDAPIEYPIDTGQFIGNLESFYTHRNAIMHGDPNAYFDMQIATAALQFLILTFEVVFPLVDGNYIPNSWTSDVPEETIKESVVRGLKKEGEFERFYQEFGYRHPWDPDSNI